MTIEEQDQITKRMVRPAPVTARPALHAMLEARSVALVGASPRPGSFGQRMIGEVGRSPSGPDIYLVNPRYRQIGERACYPSLADLPGPADLVLLGVPDAALEQQLSLAARCRSAAAVIFGNAHEQPGAAPAGLLLRDRLAAIAAGAGMQLCGAGCMGFVNVARGLRAIGYVEPGQLPAGPVALVTHSGSVFSAMLRSGRAIGFTLAVSSGQELVTTAAAYLEYALALPETRVIALVLEAMREPARLRAVLASAAARDIPVVLLTVGSSASGQAMVAAHSGALAARDGGWEALAGAYGVHRAGDLAELTDTLELFAIGRRAQLPPSPTTPASPTTPTTSPSPTIPTTSPSPTAPTIPASPIIPTTSPSPTAPTIPASPTIPGSPITPASPTTPTTPASPVAHGGGSRDRTPPEVCDRAIHHVRPGLGGEPATAAAGGRQSGIATVHDSGLERAHAADLADQIGVPYASIGEPTLARLAGLLDPGMQPANPLDMWGTGRDAQQQLADSLVALADDPAVTAVALAVDLVREFDGDRSYPAAVLDAAARTAKPVTVLANFASAVDQDVAGELRRSGIPVLEGMRTGLLALRHLLDHAARTIPASPAAPVISHPGQGRPPEPGSAHPEHIRRPAGHPEPDEARRARGVALLAAGQAAGAPLLDLLRAYGIAAARARPAAGLDAVLAAASAIGYPVVLKTDEPGVPHKSDAGGVLLGISSPAELTTAYLDLSARLGPRALVCETIPAGPELALGIARDADLGPLIVVGAGGVLVELLADRVVALPPVSQQQAGRMLARLRAGRLLAGVRGAPPADLGAVIRAVTGLSALAAELGDELEALDVNPLICGAAGAVAVDALAIARRRG